MEKEIREKMEYVIREENSIKEERQNIDNCLRRCKILANMMITMKKLAMVQDPTLAYGSKKKNKLTGIATTIQNSNTIGLLIFLLIEQDFS